MTRFTFPLCTHLPRATSPTTISSAMTIIDLEHVSFGALWRLRNRLQEASRLSTVNYPETLHAIAIVSSPSSFPTIWNWIKGWFDEGTRQKILVIGKDPGTALLELIDDHNLPAPYGGALEWKFVDDPHLDEDTKQAVGTVILKGPVIFVNGSVERYLDDYFCRRAIDSTLKNIFYYVRGIAIIDIDPIIQKWRRKYKYLHYLFIIEARHKIMRASSKTSE